MNDDARLPSCGHDSKTEMAWFDKLPKCVRAALRESKFDFCAHEIMFDVRRFHSQPTIRRIQLREAIVEAGG